MATTDSVRSVLEALTPALLIAAPVAFGALHEGSQTESPHGPTSAPSAAAHDPEGAGDPQAAGPAAPGSPPTLAARSPGLSIFSVDVGQGDASVVLGPPDAHGRRKTLLVDAGDRGRSRIVSELLRAQGVTVVDYVVLSHFDADHLGGFVNVGPSKSLLWDRDCAPTSYFPRSRLFDNGGKNKPTDSARDWQRCAWGDTLPVPAEHVQDGELIGEVLDLGGSYTATIVAGGGYVLGQKEPQKIAKADSDNERSIAVLVSGPGDFDCLIEGDLIGQEYGEERAPLEGALGAELKRRKIKVEVLRASHHGAANGSERGFLESIQPEVVIISTGKNNHGHPAKRTYDTLGAVHTRLVLQTEAGTPPSRPPAFLETHIANGTIRTDVSGADYRITPLGSVSPQNGLPTAEFEYSCTVAAGCFEGERGPQECCRFCSTGTACGDTCITSGKECLRPRGCACDP